MDMLTATDPLVRQSSLRALGVSLAPSIPSLAEAAGLPSFDAGAFGGYMAPAGMPRPIIKRLAAECEKAMHAPELRERYASIGIEL